VFESGDKTPVETLITNSSLVATGSLLEGLGTDFSSNSSNCTQSTHG
jgi:hypothetical protein